MQHNDVTIGIPVFNEEKYVEAAIRAAAPQCHVLLVSDNASTDRSREICEQLACEIGNMVLLRHPANTGASANFKFLLDRAATAKFMWLGGHDLVPEGYVSKLDHALTRNAASVLAYGAVEHIGLSDERRAKCEYAYSRSLEDDSHTTRLLALIRYLSDCSLIHGLFRTNALRAAWVDEIFIGGDHVLLSKAALLGKFAYVPDTYLLRRDVHVEDTKEAQLERIAGDRTLGSASFLEMQRQQYALVRDATRGNALKGVWDRFKARVFLVGRFGPFTSNAPASGVEKCLQAIFRLRKRLLSRVT
jgi:glycosyltransferase involved in cell wall biosynthesis